MCVWQPTAIVMSSSLKGLPINKTSQAVFTVCSLFCLRKKNASSYAKMYLLRALGSFTSMPRCICWGHLVLSQICQDVSAEGIWFFHPRRPKLIVLIADSSNCKLRETAGAEPCATFLIVIVFTFKCESHSHKAVWAPNNVHVQNSIFAPHFKLSVATIVLFS